MNKGFLFFLSLITLASLFIGNSSALAANSNLEDPFLEILSDTIPLPGERDGNFLTEPTNNPFDLEDPPIIEQNVEYDPETGQYIITESLGGFYFRPPTYMSFEEYVEWSANQQRNDYFNKLSNQVRQSDAISSNDPISKIDIEKNLVDRLFGGTDVQIRPQGNIDLTFGVDYQRVDNPILTERQRRQGGFDFDMDIQMNVVGQIGDKMKLSTNYNTLANFNFENQMKLGYSGTEDEILQKLESGDVSLPLRSSLIQGSQSLFGIKSELKFGRLTLTSILSQQQSKRKNIAIQGGSQQQTFEVTSDKYDENRHFFLSHYNRNTYEPAQVNLPQISTLFKIVKMEVWVTNKRNATQNVRDIVAFTDLGEGDMTKLSNTNSITPIATAAKDFSNQILPSNEANSLYGDLLDNPDVRALDNAVFGLTAPPFGLQQVKDFQQVRARKLSPSEFTFHEDLGYLSLNLTLQPDEILGVAFEYTYNGQVYRVGEFAQESPLNPDTLSTLYVKMLKTSTPRIDQPIWDLMMKNVYSLGAYQVNGDEFTLDVFYQDPGGGEIRFIPDGNVNGTPLIRLLNLDNLNRQGDPYPDGVFDFVPGTTINPRNGRVIFPVLEPFGSSLEAKFDDENIAKKYVYQQLYDSTITRAREYPEFNRFLIKGTYRSSVSSEISLGAFNIPRGSVTVTAGGQRLTEGIDYDIDYNIGRIKIVNDNILNSGVPINVSFEDNTLAGFQTKSLIGTRADYWINDNFTLGATWMRLSERPFTQKVNIGDDPIKNSIYGFDIQYSTELPWLTKAIDGLPLVETKAPSSMSFTGEVAYLNPGSSKAIELNDESTVYIDDFEGAASRIDLRTPANAWILASVPQNDEVNNNPLFPESALINDPDYGKNRALLNWYRIDNGLRAALPTDVYTRSIRQEEVFPNIQLQPGQNTTIQTFDLSYYPDERGPYNYDAAPTDISAGVAADGKLNDPESRWAGIMRSLNTNDFEQSNIEFIEVWMLSPFLEDNPTAQGDGGDLYINLGNVSEDVLRDSRKFFENGIPRTDDVRTDTTAWGRIPRTQPVVNAFDNDEEVRVKQDVGLDGLDNEGERSHFNFFLDEIQSLVSTTVFSEVSNDPSGDDYTYYNDNEVWTEDNGILDRYKRYNNQQGNSQSGGNSNVLSAGTNIPDSEDIDRDNTLNQNESYFQYKIPLRREGSGISFNDFVVDTANTADGTWYQMKIPIEKHSSVVGGIQDFRSIRFIRMYLKGFEAKTTLRFARLELVRNQWRKYSRLGQLLLNDISDDPIETDFDVTAVNIEENSSRTPFRYVLPPGIQREQSLGPFPDALQNEQSISVRVCNLQDGDARGIFKTINLDMRQFKDLNMFVHAESLEDLPPGKMTAFMRLGSDFENNYYEYEIPLTLSQDNGTGDPNLYAQEVVWLTENNFDFSLEKLKDVKVRRNVSDVSLTELYSEEDTDNPGKFIKVKGNPDLGLVKGIMIGIRNPSDDGAPVCGEIWVNELRVSGFDDRGGIAGLARLDVTLADLGNLSSSVNYSGIGYGSIEQKLAERSREEVLQYDVASSLQLGRFLPKESGVQIPFYAQYSQTIKTPQFDPYTRDIPLRELLEAETNPTQRDSLKSQAQDVTSIKSINFTNVRKSRSGGGSSRGGSPRDQERRGQERGGSKAEQAQQAKTKAKAGKEKKTTPMPWDIENFSLTYAYTQTEKNDPTILSNLVNQHRGSLDYAYSGSSKYIKPFNKIGSQKYLKWLKDFNFNPLPSSITFGTQLDRYFGSTTYRFSDGLDATWYDKRFHWDRNYGLQWNLAKSLNLSYSAINRAVIDEPDEKRIRNTFGTLDEVNAYRNDSIWSNIRSLGRTKDYSHQITAGFTVPTKSIPIIDWINIKAQYSANYAWNAAALNTDSLGNVVQNGNTRQLSGDFNFVNLYNKSKYLKQINSKARPQRKGRAAPPKKTIPKNGEKEGKKKVKKNRVPSKAERILLRPLMLVRKGRVTYSENYSSVVPGFMPTTQFLGMNNGFTAPGWGFIAGVSPTTAWLDNAAANDWISYSVFQNQQVFQNFSQNFDASLNIEPFKDFRIDIDANRSLTKNHTEYFKADEIGGELKHLVPRDVGSLSMSFFTLNTLFNGVTDNGLSVNFLQFEENRSIISQRLGIEGSLHDVDGSGYTDGYGRYQQEVLIPAFLSAYTGTDAATTETDLFGVLPMPNWRLTYNGLSRVKGMDKIFKSVSVSHSYRSGFTVNSFQTDLDWDPQFPQGNKNPLSQNYFSEFEIPNIAISEQFSPLIGVDIRTNNDITARFDWKKTRNLQMNFIDLQLSETQTNEITLGLGYKVKGAKLPFNMTIGKGKKKTDKLENDLEFRFDFSLRDDITTNHLLDQNVSEPTRGMKTITIAPSIDYMVNKRLSLRLFFDQRRSIPATSASFPITNTSAGVTVRFSLAE